MAPHLSLAELDLIAKSSGEQKAPKDIHALISSNRRARKVDPRKIWAVRRVKRHARKSSGQDNVIDRRGSGAATANTEIAYYSPGDPTGL